MKCELFLLLQCIVSNVARRSAAECEEAAYVWSYECGSGWTEDLLVEEKLRLLTYLVLEDNGSHKKSEEHTVRKG